ncbi:MAG TPA: NUDIX domain-containing protein [Actinomycetota bacterium]|jgi:predicted NUDIX family NTP pyrophosphohydrolase|nr:NUDIX domain-containing protein [Actinomycetota bacterium]
MKGGPRRSAGILLWRRASDGSLEVLLGHPGGPYFAKKDADVWSILKGEYASSEDPFDVAKREFFEESGHYAPDGPALELGEIRQKGGKLVVAWALEGDLDPLSAWSNTFPMEWPPRSGRTIQVPEIDRVAWFDLAAAREKLKAAQHPLLERLSEAVDVETS